MNDRIDLHPEAGDDVWLEALLRDPHASPSAPQVPDDGFTARVMEMIPAPAPLPAWRKPALTALWAVSGLGLAVALPGAVTDIAQDALRLVLSQHVSLREIALAVLALAGASWAGTLYALREDR